ncbi:MAG TPA: flagellar motor switch protein FliG [Bryobacteraceae bacterium]|jgi:flagellar motor switch protein FliG
MAAAAMATTLTGLQKSAVLLVALGDAASSEFLKRLSDEEVQKVSGAIASLPPVTPAQAEAVLEEFHAATSDAMQVGRGGVEYARRLLTSAFGPEGSKKHLDRLPNSTSRAGQNLQQMDPPTLARFVKSEHPQTVALILSHLNPAQSAAVLGVLDGNARADLAIRIAKLGQISPAVIERISDIIGRKLKSLGEVTREPSGGPRAVAEIFNQLDSNLSDEILAQIGELNADIGDSIRQKMFVFNDLLAVDPSGVKELLARADRRQLTMALKGASEDLRKHLLQGMSQRGASMLLEDMEALGPVKIRDVEAAQQTLIGVVRQLESDGLLSRKKGGGGASDEQYI